MWHDVKSLNVVSGALLGLAGLMLVASGLWWLAQRPMFTLQTIRVEGVLQQGGHAPLRHVNALTVRAAALPRIKGNFFTTNLDAVRAAFESVPWVRKAAVRREWPNTLIVDVEEHQPLGTWGDQGQLVSVKGEVFTANLAEAEDDADLVELAGPPGSEKDVVARYADFGKWFAPLHMEPEAVRLSSRYAWEVRLSNGVTVELGREQTHSTLQERVGKLVAIYPQLAARLQDRIENVDMRYPNGLALKASGSAGMLDGKKK